MKRTMELRQDDRFWAIEVAGAKVTTWWGRSGVRERSTVTLYAANEAAQLEAITEVQRRLASGYTAWVPS